MSSASIKRQRKRKRNTHDEDPEFQVAPMVDVLLVLLLFFMAITSTEVLKKDPNLQLAEAKHGKKPEKKDKNITVNIGWDKANTTAQFSMDGHAYKEATDLTAPLSALHTANPKYAVLIRSDQDVQYSNVADLMNACAAAGIGTVTFSVIKKVGPEGAAPEGAAASN